MATDDAVLADFERYMDSDGAPEGVQALAAMFPQLEESALRAALTSYGGVGPAALALSDTGGSERAVRDRREGRRVERREERREEVVGMLRMVIVPALRAHFAELVLDDVREDTTGYLYEMEGVEVAALTLPEDNVVVRAPVRDTDVIKVHVVNAFLELEVARFRYESRSIVPLKDSGKARVSVGGLSLAITLRPRVSHSGATMVAIGDCNVGVEGPVRFKAEGTAADWAYNTMAVVLKPLVVSYIKDAVGDAVCTSLTYHLREWSSQRHTSDHTSSSPQVSSPGAGAEELATAAR